MPPVFWHNSIERTILQQSESLHTSTLIEYTNKEKEAAVHSPTEKKTSFSAISKTKKRRTKMIAKMVTFLYAERSAIPQTGALFCLPQWEREIEPCAKDMKVETRRPFSHSSDTLTQPIPRRIKVGVKKLALIWEKKKTAFAFRPYKNNNNTKDVVGRSAKK